MTPVCGGAPSASSHAMPKSISSGWRRYSSPSLCAYLRMRMCELQSDAVVDATPWLPAQSATFADARVCVMSEHVRHLTISHVDCYDASGAGTCGGCAPG